MTYVSLALMEENISFFHALWEARHQGLLRFEPEPAADPSAIGSRSDRIQN